MYLTTWIIMKMLIGAANVMIKIDKMRWVSWLICSIVLKVLGLEVTFTKEITIKYAWSITSFTFFDKKLFLRNEIQYLHLKYQSKYIAIISILNITLKSKIYFVKFFLGKYWNIILVQFIIQLITKYSVLKYSGLTQCLHSVYRMQCNIKDCPHMVLGENVRY